MKKMIAVAIITTFAAGTAFAQSANSTATTSATDSTANVSTTVSTIPRLTSDEMTSSKIVGTSVYNTNNEKIGAVNDLIFDANGKVAGVVIGVGGFLGMGERNVALTYTSVKFSKDSKGAEHITVAATKDQLKAMTPYDSKANG